MDQQVAESLSRQLRISPEQAVRVEHEILILRELRKYLPANQWPVIEMWTR